MFTVLSRKLLDIQDYYVFYLWQFRHLIRAMRRHDLTKIDYDNGHPIREHPCDLRHLTNNNIVFNIATLKIKSGLWARKLRYLVLFRKCFFLYMICCYSLMKQSRLNCSCGLIFLSPQSVVEYFCKMSSFYRNQNFSAKSRLK